MSPPASGAGQLWSRHFPSGSLRRAISTATPALIFGLRLSASVCLALYIAFWLQLDNAYWAAASAAAVNQPSLGASLRKGWFRMIGTLTGATFIVVLTACFVQNRIAFLMGLALWGGGCALVATLLRNFATYAAALAGFTAVIVASDELGATGGATGGAFMFAVTRAGEICIGIACAGVILGATDFGGARRRLATVLANLTQQITGQFVATLTATAARRPDTQSIRREFIRRVIALDPTIDQAIGESSQLRHNSYRLQQAVYGLIDALAGWRTVVSHLARLSQDRQTRHELREVLQGVPRDLLGTRAYGNPSQWTANPMALQRVCQKAVRELTAMPPGTGSKQLLIDQMIKILEVDSPETFGFYPYSSAAVQHWVYNSKPAILIRDHGRYLRIDVDERRRAQAEWNKPVWWPMVVLTLAFAGLLLVAVQSFKRRERMNARGELLAA